jgi:hypothetical protein
MRLQELFERADQANEVIGILQTGLTVDSNSNIVDISSDLQFQDFLKKNYQVNEIGSGAYSVVHLGSEGADFVLKSSHSGKSAHYDRWYRFAKIAKSNQQNSLMPKILFAGEPAWNSQLKYGILEYLSMRQADELNEIALDAFGFSDFFYAMSESREFYMMPAHARIPKKAQQVESFLDALKINPREFEAFVRAVDPNGNFDVHDGNIGWRKDGSAVIFDPVS